MSWLITLAALLSTMLLGSMVFFAAVMAPLIFTKLSADTAGPFIREVFPRYYLWGLVVSVVAMLSALAGVWLDVVLLALTTVGFVYARQWLMPMINHKRDVYLAGDETAKTAFERLHLQSVVVNGLQMVLLGVVAWRLI